MAHLAEIVVELTNGHNMMVRYAKLKAAQADFKRLQTAMAKPAAADCLDLNGMITTTVRPSRVDCASLVDVAAFQKANPQQG